MLPEYFQPDKLLLLIQLLFRLDQDLASNHQAGRCPFCGGPLHRGNYQRKPRGLLDKIPDHYLTRQSFCCGNLACRRRSAPPSILFMGRRVYWRGAILTIMALRQRRPQSASKASLVRLFNVNRQTIDRWVGYFQEIFPKTEQWQRLRGRIWARVADRDLPGALLDFFNRHQPAPEVAFLGCLRFLATGFIS
jgi:hypothetical protein